MRIVLDLQAAQTKQVSDSDFFKQPPLLLAKAIARHRGKHEVLLLLSDRFSDTIEPLRACFDSLLPPENVRVWAAPAWMSPDAAHQPWRDRTSALIREAFLASLQPDIVHFTAPIGEPSPDVALSIGTFTQTLPTAVTLLESVAPVSLDGLMSEWQDLASWRLLDHLKRANLWLAVSESLRQESAAVLGISQEQIVHLAADEEQDNGRNWDIAAERAIAAFEKLHHGRSSTTQVLAAPTHRPKLAYISPLPPEKSGIADYSAELLPELARYYEIEVVVAQDTISDLWINANCPIRSVEWFEAHAYQYDRILYHFGNSHYHQHMFSLLERFPGVVALHDFYLGHIVAAMEMQNASPYCWTRELYHAHGYAAVQERFKSADLSAVVFKYPCNLSILQQANSVIVHSSFARRLANQWYGDRWSEDWGQVNMPRVPPGEGDRLVSRQILGIPEDAFLICSFGMLGQIKQNHRLLNAWLNSAIAQDPNTLLVFVGENPGGEYGKSIAEAIERSGLSEQVQVTGWTDMPTFRHYLRAADVAVQLRSSSRGETSAAALDCLNYGLPTVVNASGSMAELPQDAVWMVPEEFTDADLTYALETLWQNTEKRQALSQAAECLIHTLHTPQECASQYFNYIEQQYSQCSSSQRLIQGLSSTDNSSVPSHDWLAIAQSVAQSFPPKQPAKQLFVDVSAICRSDLKTGVQRVVRSLLMEWLNNPPPGYRIEPVYFTFNQGWQCYYARKYTLGLLQCPLESLCDEPVDIHSGDIFLGADLTNDYIVQNEKAGFFAKLQNHNVKTYFVVYDLLPILRPEVFPPNVDKNHLNWLSSVSRVGDGAICISQAVAEELAEWMRTNQPDRMRPFNIGWFHLGADIQSSSPTKGLPDDAEALLAKLSTAPTFLMVGTVEPRKGHRQTLEAIEQLWRQGQRLNLVIVGKQGWLMEDLAEKIRQHPEYDKQLFWLSGISDEYLEQIYAASSCLISPSEGEGFGLPLIEAAQHSLPIIARDIPVFREVAKENAYYFQGLTPEDLATAIQDWLMLYQSNKHPRSDQMPWQTWEKSAKQLLETLL
ncbi:glycosyltransferase [Thermoleptolyngbya oregonensis NK1-22]|uniref:Glycosyltransferase n=1 Tax=Thermoleptolyngbya oregonensis NK1-22 TaxID=2547457 RepID=A0AA96Y4P3_9CYAN|nr:glycosyltransferase [Thermoleptolyngbya oregonensis NK1-22]